ncbi:MAG: carbon-nitrogen hydrolase family protein [Pseudomonadota bacterium]
MTDTAPLAAAVQMQSGEEVAANLELADGLLAEAAAQGACLAVLPENFALMPKRSRQKTAAAETPGRGPIQSFLAEAAVRHGLWVVAGSLPLASPDSRRTYGASLVFDTHGECRAIYRKIHLFDVDLADSAESYRESRSMYPGDEPVTLDTPLGTLGLSVCYDLRFPELYRELVDAGAELFTVPAAFTETTGRAHWHTLLKARAIENLAYVIAPGQTGVHADGRSTYGHSLIVDPWGRITAELDSGSGVAVAAIDLPSVRKLRREFPALANRRLASRRPPDQG